MYAVLDDILERISESELIGLTNDEGGDTVDTSVVDRAIADAGSLVDGYCQSRDLLPFQSVPPLIRMVTVDLAVFNLFSRRTHIDVPDGVKARQKQAVDTLKQIQAGKIPVVDGSGETVGSDEPETIQVAANDALFSKEELDKY